MLALGSRASNPPHSRENGGCQHNKDNSDRSSIVHWALSVFGNSVEGLGA
jgi:hypothetical protein